MNATRIMRVIVTVSILAGVLWTTEQAQSQVKKSPGVTTTEQPQDKQKVQKRAGATQDKIHADVRSKLEESEDGTVYVMVTLKPLPKEGLNKEQRKTMAKEKQDKLLAKLAEGEFKVDHRFAAEPRMIGHVNAAGLDKLKSNANVEAIEPSIIGPYVFPALKDSTTGRIDLFIALEDDDLKTLDPGEQEQRIVVTQDRVLALLTNKEFKRTSWYTNIATLTGWGGAGALEKLATCPDVEAVGQNLKLILPPPPRPLGSRPAAATEKEQTMVDERIHPIVCANLDTSGPSSKADQVQALGYTGKHVVVAELKSAVVVDKRERSMSSGIVLANYVPQKPPPDHAKKKPQEDPNHLRPQDKQKTETRSAAAPNMIHPDSSGDIIQWR